MFGSTTNTSSTLGRSASFSFSQPPATKPFAGTSGGFSFGGGGGGAASTQPQPQQQQQQQQPSTGFSFGAAAPKPAAAGGGGGLFGSTTNSAAPNTSQPTTTGGLFGNTTTTTTGGGGSGLFGAASTNKPATTSGFSFGASTSTQQPQQPQQQQQGGGGLFGASTSSNTGLFGQSQSGFQPGGSQQPFGQQQQQQQQQQGQVAASPFFRFAYQQRERYNDLPEDARKLVEELDKHISTQLQIKDELKTKDFGVEIRKCAAEWQELDSALTSLAATLELDSSQSRDVAERIERDRADQATLYAIASNAREGRSDGAGFVEWLQTYFGHLADDFQRRIQRYRNGMETVERHLAGLERRDTFTPQAISDTIQAQHASFMALANQVASLHAQVDTLKRDYARWYQQTHKSYRDPFASMSQLAGSINPSSPSPSSSSAAPPL
ncbi:uncharacterized protein PFL1_04021 [Pseudozyma flocculosa PF-1]|uniref:Related to NUP49 - nuclear pore protein n=2 Tax=Pseudozyma flocculosa TaxID=84751 RepID=A0A5C3EST8_9BASI|nr:uncharacterized protein PFL1_04021 [Pseudozyma flocculosa PF-1]EPQ28193.1 hypothetical protein PFL1_04021 [Pseudozyma flocculosa PF-1]SPO35328.1 related to NUP49 - nuclear pore protein [Pseudozyma flocculosa]